VTGEVERSLGPAQYHFRLPWFAEVTGPDTVCIGGGTQAIMDAEIAYAARAGIDYWAFVIYPEQTDMSLALKLYLQSPDRRRVGFCMILHGDIDCPGEQWPGALARHVRLMREPGYQTVLHGRPLVYVFRPGMDAERERTRLAAVRQAARDAGLQDPYIVYMGFNPARDWATARDMGCDAISAYAHGGQGAYNDLTQAVRRDYWEGALKAGAQLVPLASAGWDRRPRIDHPVSWERSPAQLANRDYVETATPGQIAAHVRDALDWTQQHPDACPAQAIIVYAWNENDEGGWLVPTRKDDGTADTSRVDALHQMLERHAGGSKRPTGQPG
jgi:hypothetical protein